MKSFLGISVENTLIIFAAAFFLFAIAVFVLLIITIRSSKLDRKELTKQLSNVQDNMFTSSAQILAEKLTTFAKTSMMDKINDSYATLINEELLPSVNKAAETTIALAENLVARQESGMRELAEIFSSMLTEKTNESVSLQTEIITQLRSTTNSFANELHNVSSSVKELAELQNYTLDMSNNLSNNIAGTVDTLCNKIRSLEEIYNGTSLSINDLQKNIAESAEIVRSLCECSAAAQQSATEANGRLTEYSENTALLLNNAVSAMQNNAGDAAVAVINEFSKKININYSAVTETVNKLNEISDKMTSSANVFNSAIGKVYDDFSEQLNSNIGAVASTVAKTVISEYGEITGSAEKYAQSLTDNASNLSNQFNVQIHDLNSFNEQLNNKLSGFSDDILKASSRFESGIDKTVEDALNQMDSSVADIAKRLTDVTLGIKDAADALPKAMLNVRDGK